MATLGAWSGRNGNVFGDLHAATHSDELRSRPGGLRGQVRGCGLAGRSYERRGIGRGRTEWELVYELMEFMVDCCVERKNKEATVAVKWMGGMFT